MNNYVIC